jgi:hypothetical protein
MVADMSVDHAKKNILLVSPFKLYFVNRCMFVSSHSTKSACSKIL